MSTQRWTNALSRLAAAKAPEMPRHAPAGVSIAVINWNHEFVLPRSVRTALRAVECLKDNQVPAEVLVIDDASRDGSSTLLRQLEALYYNQGMRVLLQEKNGGPEVSRNAALSQATYRHLVFLDADNELVPENLHQFYRASLQTRAAGVYGNLIRRGPGPGDLDLCSNESFQIRMFDGNYIDTCGLFDRLQIADLGGQANHLATTAHEDWELYLHLAVNGRKLVFVPLVFGIYYVIGGSHLETAADRQVQAEKLGYMRRVYDQLGIRKQQKPRTLHLRYHPDIGYI